MGDDRAKRGSSDDSFPDSLYIEYNRSYAQQKGAETQPLWTDEDEKLFQEGDDAIFNYSTSKPNELELMRIINSATSRPAIQESASFQCGRCKGRRIQFAISQDRSGDESASVHYSCLSCGNTWYQR